MKYEPEKLLFTPIVISGPSGVGKGTLIQMLLKKYHDKFDLSVSYTCREPRPGEVHGKNYYFIKDAEFNTMVNNNEFIEYVNYNDKQYGTAIKEIQRV